MHLSSLLTGTISFSAVIVIQHQWKKMSVTLMNFPAELNKDSKDIGERNWTFNTFSRARASIYSPSFIKTDLKDLLRLVQYHFFIVSQSETSNILTARKGWFFKVLLRVASVSQLSFYFFHTDIYWAKFRDLQTELETIVWKSYIKTHVLLPFWIVPCLLSVFNYHSAVWGPGQTSGHLCLCVQ